MAVVAVVVVVVVMVVVVMVVVVAVVVVMVVVEQDRRGCPSSVRSPARPGKRKQATTKNHSAHVSSGGCRPALGWRPLPARERASRPARVGSK